MPVASKAMAVRMYASNVRSLAREVRSAANLFLTFGLSDISLELDRGSILVTSSSSEGSRINSNLPNGWGIRCGEAALVLTGS